MKGKRVLIVEDDNDLRATLAETLKREGFDVMTCSSGEDALAELRADAQVGLVLLDVLLPLQSGWAVQRAMMNDERLASIPVVAMSAGRVEMPTAVEVLKKPVKLQVLLETVNRYISGHGGRGLAKTEDRGSL
jgi:DNA-binding response OmpR family regulator